jgi:CBS domain-containing protein
MTKNYDLPVSELMTTAVITLSEKETITHADAEMKWAGIRHLPVTDRHGRLVGIVSNRDILRALGDSGGAPVPVHEVMTRDVLTVRPDTYAREAVDLMLEYKVDSLPVISDEDVLVGIITATDFLELAARALGGERFEDPALER